MKRNQIRTVLSLREGIALAVVLMAIFLPRFLALGYFVSPDENLWLNRSANFYFALGQRDFAATYQKEHPGVTVMWAGTAAFLIRYPGYRGSGLGQVETDQFHYYMNHFSKVTPLEILITARLILLIGHVLVLTLSYWFARDLAGTLPALLGFLLLAFDPYHISLTRILHLDGLSSNLILLTVLSFQSYQVHKRISSLLISGAAAGLACLTKSPSFFLIPIVGLLVLPDFWKRMNAPGAEKLWRRVWAVAWPVMVWAGIAVLIFVILWPAMWVTPVHAVSQVFSQAQRYMERGHFSPIYYNGIVFENGEIGPTYVAYYLQVFLWRSTPLVLLGVLLAILGCLFRLGLFKQQTTRTATYGLTVIAAVFYIGLTLSAKKFDRYFLPAIVPADVLAGLGWVTFFSWFQEFKWNKVSRIVPAIGLAAVILLQLTLAVREYPYYSTYYNSFLGGSRKAMDVFQIGWGEGIDQAAKYLNQKSDAEHLHVSSWYSNGSFSYFFKGHTRWMGFNSDMSDGDWNRFLTSDYAVIYISQWQRHTPQPILDYVSERTPEHVVTINGLDYVWIYKIR